MFSPAALSYVDDESQDQELYWGAYHQFIRDVTAAEAATNTQFLSALYKKKAGSSGGGGSRLHLSLLLYSFPVFLHGSFPFCSILTSRYFNVLRLPISANPNSPNFLDV